MKYLYKISLILTVFISFIANAQPPCPSGGDGGGGAGGVTSGAPASPIDDYIIYLAIVGLFVIYYTYKKSNRLVKN